MREYEGKIALTIAKLAASLHVFVSYHAIMVVQKVTRKKNRCMQFEISQLELNPDKY